MKVYHWSMRNASIILFSLSAVLFLVGLGQALVAYGNTSGGYTTEISGQAIGSRASSLLLLLGGTLGAFSAAVVPFVGAAAIHRWDQFKAKDTALQSAAVAATGDSGSGRR